MSVIIRATNSDGQFTTVGLSIKPRLNGVNADGRRTVIDDDNANGTANLDEQTWDYDYFGRVTDHNDLSGADYDYAYDPLTGQQFRQNSHWTEAAREYSTPLLDRWEDNEWHRYGLDPTLENLYLPPRDPVEINNPERTLSYYANGQLKQIQEGRNWTKYSYDASGNRTMEETVTHDANGQILRLRTSVSYDAHNRIAKVTQDDVGANRRLLELRYDYDAVGNRRRVLARGAYDGAQVIGFDNLPPLVNQAIAPQHVVLGEAWSFKVPAQTFRDPEDGPLRIEAAMADGSAMPAWLTYDRATRTFRGTPTQDTNLTLRLTAFDLDDLSVSSDFVLTASVNQPPQVTGVIAAQTASVGLAWSLPTSGVFADPEGRPLSYRATLADGSALPNWLQIDPASGRLS
ncbi:MAG: putative Ig domain-containing protein, partial [Lysobacter sp.]